MTLSIRTCIIILSLIAATAIPMHLSAQDNGEKSNHQPRYKLIDLGTFGGPGSLVNDGLPPVSQVVNDRGAVVGAADTSTPDPYSPYCFIDCVVAYAFLWQDGTLTDLGSLPGVNSSLAIEINRDSLIIGVSENGSSDPLTGFPEVDPVLWKNGQILNLGTFGGTQGIALTVNDRGQVVGGALNTIPDAFASSFDSLAFFYPGTTQMHAFLWEKALMQDLGTLGGPDSEAFYMNQREQVTGVSYTNATVNPVTGFPTEDPFLWQRGRMLDLGSLGGTFGYPSALNERGQVAGTSNLAGDHTYHPFLWTSPGPMRDLGTLGGSTGIAFWANDEGEVVGRSDLPGSGVQRHHAFLWKEGAMADLGTIGSDPCSIALSINTRGQIVGTSTNCTEYLHGFISENGGPATDLNSLVQPGSALTIREGDFINDRGEIAGKALLSSGDIHAVLLIPCDSDHPGLEGCDYDPADFDSTVRNAPANEVTTSANSAPIVRPATSAEPGNQLRMRFGRHYGSDRPKAAPAN